MYLPLHKILGEWLSLSICRALCQLLGKQSSSETLCPYTQENVKSLPKEKSTRLSFCHQIHLSPGLAYFLLHNVEPCFRGESGIFYPFGVPLQPQKENKRKLSTTNCLPAKWNHINLRGVQRYYFFF